MRSTRRKREGKLSVRFLCRELRTLLKERRRRKTLGRGDSPESITGMSYMTTDSFSVLRIDCEGRVEAQSSLNDPQPHQNHPCFLRPPTQGDGSENENGRRHPERDLSECKDHLDQDIAIHRRVVGSLDENDGQEVEQNCKVARDKEGYHRPSPRNVSNKNRDVVGDGGDEFPVGNGA